MLNEALGFSKKTSFDVANYSTAQPQKNLRPMAHAIRTLSISRPSNAEHATPGGYHHTVGDVDTRPVASDIARRRGWSAQELGLYKAKSLEH